MQVPIRIYKEIHCWFIYKAK